ncbi:MAG: hypothetical protein LBI48_09670 [Burkholderiaceae bacterium]|nr:hypothetical protein [Burkholderiaceae bacterium]
MKEKDLQGAAQTMRALVMSDEPGAPGNPFFNVKDSIHYLRKEINLLLTGGWTYGKVASFLTEQGIPCKTSTLSVYMNYDKYRKNALRARNDSQASILA